MTSASLISSAVATASHAFVGKLDRLGKPMILHSLRVGLAGTTPDEMIVGFLHDIIEDTEATLEGLCMWPEHIVAAVDALSRREGETYRTFIERVRAAGPLAIAVKRNDIADNLGRALELPEDERRRLTIRWTKALVYLRIGSWPGSEFQTSA